MSTPAPTGRAGDAPCPHAWEPTGITVWVSGRKWQQGDECSYCPLCRQFSRRTRFYLDGRFFKTDAEAHQANDAAWTVYTAEKAAWQQEHYPEHVPALPAEAARAGEEATADARATDR